MKALTKGFRICRIFGISIELNWSLLFLIALVAWSMVSIFRKALPESSSVSLWLAGFSYGLLLVFSVIFHELSHSLTAKRFKIQVSQITLFFMGGIAMMDGEKAFEKPSREIVITAAGPLSSLLLAGIFFVLRYLFDSSLLVYYVLGYISVINVVLAAFNLIPCFPMDGGRIFRAICFWVTKDFVRATRIARNTAFVVSILMVAVVSWLGGVLNGLIIVFIVLFFLIPAAELEYREALLAQKLRGVKVKDLMRAWSGLLPAALIPPEDACQLEDDAIKVVRQMLGKRIQSLAVKDQGKTVGMIMMGDIELYLKGLSKQRL